MMGTSIVTRADKSAKPIPWRLRVTFWLDVVLLVSICTLQTVRFTGLVLHEWLGLAVIGMTLAHLMFSWSWIASQSRRLFRSRSIRERTNYLLNLSLFAVITATIYSGILISQKAVPVLTGAKTAAEMNWQWDHLHNQFANFVIVLVGMHLALNWDWILAAVSRMLERFVKGGR
jgi:cytochrome b561